jgi:hypothetical protein
MRKIDLSDAVRAPALFVHLWAEQEKERRAKFSWGQRRLEDGKIIFTNVYYVGGLIVFAALVVGPWAIGVRTIWRHFAR